MHPASDVNKEWQEAFCNLEVTEFEFYQIS